VSVCAGSNIHGEMPDLSHSCPSPRPCEDNKKKVSKTKTGLRKSLTPVQKAEEIIKKEKKKKQQRAVSASWESREKKGGREKIRLRVKRFSRAEKSLSEPEEATKKSSRIMGGEQVAQN